jgi:magnesium chelatase family protein
LFDLAIVATVLAAKGLFRAEELRRTVLLGELGLDRRLRPVRGVLPATLAAQQAGFTRVIVPLRQSGEAMLVEGIDVFGTASKAPRPSRRRGLQTYAPHVDRLIRIRTASVLTSPSGLG